MILQDMKLYTFMCSKASTGNVTLKIDSTTALPLKNFNTGIQIGAGKIKAWQLFQAWYAEGSSCFFLRASSSGNAVAGDVLAGKTFSNNDGTDLVGTIPIMYPDFADSIPATNAMVWNNWGDGNNYAILAIYPGTFISNGVGWVRWHQPNLIPQNIKSGVPIFNIVGTGPKYSVGDVLSLRLIFNKIPIVTQRSGPSSSSIYADRIFSYDGYILRLLNGSSYTYLNTVAGSSGSWTSYNLDVTGGSGSYYRISPTSLARNGYLYCIVHRGVSELQRIQFSNGAVVRSGVQIPKTYDAINIASSDDSYVYIVHRTPTGNNPSIVTIEKYDPNTLARIATIMCTIPGSHPSNSFFACVDSSGYIYVGYNIARSGWTNCCRDYYAYWENTIWKFNPSGGTHIATYLIGSKPNNTTPNPSGMIDGDGKIGICNGIIYQSDHMNTLRSFNTSLQLTGTVSAPTAVYYRDSEEIRRTQDDRVQIKYKIFAGNCQLVGDIEPYVSNDDTIDDVKYVSDISAYGIWRRYSYAYLNSIEHAFKILN